MDRVAKSGISLSLFYHGAWVICFLLALGLSIASELLPAPIAILSTIFCLWGLSPPFLRFPIQKVWIRLLSASALLAYGAVLFFQSYDTVNIVSTGLWAALFFLVPRKQKTFGHWLSLLTLSLLCLTCAIIKPDLVTHALLLFFLFFVVITLNANNLYSLSGPGGALKHSLRRGYFRQGMTPLFIGLCGGGLVFFLFPRTQLLGTAWGIRERESTNTGYTGKISLESSNQIVEDSSIALTVESESPTWLATHNSRLYFRGNTLDHFDGKNWLNTEPVRWTYAPTVDARYSGGSLNSARALRIYREAHNTLAVIYPELLLSITTPEILGVLHVDNARNITRSNSGNLRYSYEVIVSDALPRDGDLRQSLFNLRRLVSEEVRKKDLTGRFPVVSRHLQLPARFEKKQFFRNWVQELGINESQATLESVMRAITVNFTKKFKATLTHEKGVETPLASFLTTSRTGHCEYFATASVLLLRSLGIPARMVAGYRAGTFNEVSRTLEVKERNAHAWVEVYAGKGHWSRWDPTPVSPYLDVGLKAELEAYWNAWKFWFSRYIVNYNRVTQRDLIERASLWRPFGLKTDFSWMVYVQWVVLIVFGVGVYWGLRVWRNRNHRRGRLRFPTYYRSLLRKLYGSGWRRLPGETFRAFHERLRVAGVDGAILLKFDAALHRDLYSKSPLKPEEAQRLREEADSFELEKLKAS